MEKKAILALTLGDPAGIGPEILFKALHNEQLMDKYIPVVIGDKAILSDTKNWMQSPLALRPISHPAEAEGQAGTMEYIDLALTHQIVWDMGKVNPLCGEFAFRSIREAVAFAASGQVDAVVTTPISKEALHLAGHHYAGHTELIADMTGTRHYGMMLALKHLHVMHVTTHMSMRDACDAITKERVLQTIRLTALAQAQLGLSGPIAVAGLNAHSAEGGLFGAEEAEAISPAIEAAQAMGIPAEGPIPADTVFVKALAGQYSMVVAMYHDQGHIPIKIMGFSLDQGPLISGVNCTVGLPIIRTSVDHGTAYDIAGKGQANEGSLLDAIHLAAAMSKYPGPRTLK